MVRWRSDLTHLTFYQAYAGLNPIGSTNKRTRRAGCRVRTSTEPTSVEGQAGAEYGLQVRVLSLEPPSKNLINSKNSYIIYM